MSAAAPEGSAPPVRSNCTKVFVGGLSHDVSEASFKKFFEQFGELTDTVIMYDFATRRPRGFGFVTFSERASVDKLLANKCVRQGCVCMRTFAVYCRPYPFLQAHTTPNNGDCLASA